MQDGDRELVEVLGRIQYVGISSTPMISACLPAGWDEPLPAPPHPPRASATPTMAINDVVFRVLYTARDPSLGGAPHPRWAERAGDLASQVACRC